MLLFGTPNSQIGFYVGSQSSGTTWVKDERDAAPGGHQGPAGRLEQWSGGRVHASPVGEEGLTSPGHRGASTRVGAHSPGALVRRHSPAGGCGQPTVCLLWEQPKDTALEGWESEEHCVTKSPWKTAHTPRPWAGGRLQTKAAGPSCSRTADCRPARSLPDPQLSFWDFSKEVRQMAGGLSCPE